MPRGPKFAMPENSPLPICRVCRQNIVPGAGTTIAAAGKPLFEVHNGACAETVATGVKTVGTVALNIAEIALETRVPRVLALVRGFAGILNQLRSRGAPQ
jgi:hypothetical protein